MRKHVRDKVLAYSAVASPWPENALKDPYYLREFYEPDPVVAEPINDTRDADRSAQGDS